MKVIDIKREGDIFTVYYKLNWFERLINVDPSPEVYKDTGDTFTYGGGHVYLKRNGEYLRNSDPVRKMLDKWRRKF